MGRNLEDFILKNYQKAMDYHEIQAYYQPVIRTSSRQLCSFEALARWIDPDLGMIYPDEFIPVLEAHGLIHLLDAAILRQVSARLRTSLTNGETPIPVSVNLSRLDFALTDIFAVADDIISDYQIPHDFIYFEITESVMAEQKEQMIEVVNRFRSAGYQVWMDDFGSAYSSLNVLKDFAFDELKLDMSFLRPFSLRSRRIVGAVVKMAKSIDIHTLAEGVETEEQYVYLRDIGCEKVQGYYFGRPLPYDQAVENICAKNVSIELPQDRWFFDEIGKIDYLSAVPFMKREEHDAITTARQLNSIPLSLAVFAEDHFKVLFYNSAFKEIARSAGMFTAVFTQEMLTKPQPLSRLSDPIINLMDSVKVNGDGKMLFTVNEHYFEIRARRMTEMWDKHCVLVSITNLTKDTQSERTSHLDDAIRKIYALFDRITLLNAAEDTILPLYTDTREDLLSNRTDIRELVREYAERYIYPEDIESFMSTFDPKVAIAHLRELGSASLSAMFRTYVRHGQYAWKEYTLLKIDDDNYLMLIRNTHTHVKNLISDTTPMSAGTGPYAPAQLWHNLVHSGLLKMFWKDTNRRFLGASKSFMDYYGFSSEADFVGKTDEELGWHVHPDLYMNDEYQVIHEGVTYQNMPGNCICKGENRSILASKTPLYNANGEISGLIGFFLDKDVLSIHDRRGDQTSRRELLTGLLNSRGISEEAETFADEYYLRGTDFVRIHICINDFGTINDQYGFDFGDKVLNAFGQALKATFGTRSAVGRHAGRTFIMLHQVKDALEASSLRNQVKAIGRTLREVEGKPITLYLSVGYALFSEFLDLQEQAKSAEMRLHADYDQNISAESRIDHASELFYLFDDLPVPYSVYHVTYAEHSDRYDAVFFYANHEFEKFASLPAKALVGRGARDLFPYLEEDWYLGVKSAAIDGNIVEDEFVIPSTGQHFRYTAQQIFYRGYCSITLIETHTHPETRVTEG